jgi:stearoyl-CoA desaturase (delta-9 desaturase)
MNAQLALVGVAVIALAVLVGRRRLPRGVIRIGTTLGIVAPLVATAYAIWRLWDDAIGPTELWLFVGFTIVPGLGVTIGYHRLLAHRSFETRPAVKAVLLILGAISLPSRPLDFVAHHLKHHAHSDRDDDPHSPLHGLLHAHVGWLIGDPDTRAERERYCRRYEDDRVVTFVERTAPYWFILGLLVPALIGGWSGFLWGGVVRVAFSNHVTFAVNSICHAYGSQPFETRDESRNNFVLGVLAAGEGWHNNHHAFPSAAIHGIGWRQPDLSGAIIKLLAAVGLAWNVKQPSPEVLERRRKRASARAAGGVSA